MTDGFLVCGIFFELTSYSDKTKIAQREKETLFMYVYFYFRYLMVHKYNVIGFV